MDFGLQGTVVLVTGAASGLGTTIAELYAAEGARVGVNYRTKPEQAAAVVEGIVAAGGEAFAVAGDLTQDEDVVAMYDAMEAHFGGPVEVLVNNAAYCPTAPTAELESDVYMHTVNGNMGGTFRCCKELIRRLDAAGKAGRIVNISSQAAFRGSRSGKSAYDSSKMGIVGLTISLARELSAKGYNVNCVLPGLMYTEMIADAVAKDPESFNSRVPLNRLGQTKEIADVAVFLGSKCASYMTGSTVAVDGGLSMH